MAMIVNKNKTISNYISSSFVSSSTCSNGSSTCINNGPYVFVDSEDVKYTEEHIIAKYVYDSVEVEVLELEKKDVDVSEVNNNMNSVNNSSCDNHICNADDTDYSSSDDEEDYKMNNVKLNGNLSAHNNINDKHEKNIKMIKENLNGKVNSSNIDNSYKNKVYIATKKSTEYIIRTDRNIQKVGVLIVGLGGNNGTTLLGGILANKYNLTYETKEGVRTPNYFGSICMSSTVKLGTKYEENKEYMNSKVSNNDTYNYNENEVYVPLYSHLPMIDPTNLVIGGWDISRTRLGDAMKRAQVFDIELQNKLFPYMQKYKPLKSVYYADFVAENQRDRANNLINGNTHADMLNKLRSQIKKFKEKNNLEKVLVIWSGTTERYVNIIEGVNDNAENLLNTIQFTNHSEISPSILYAVASILEGCSYINGSPQNTLIEGVIELANRENVFVGGDDFKSGQTKLKSVLVDFLISAGIKPRSIASYNHLGNNDGYNLSSPMQFRSKEISKSNVVDDMVHSNTILYNKQENEKPDHVVVIKYIPFVGDSKRAMDEYTSEIFMGGKNTLVVHNTCEDSLLAAPLILDLIILTELCERISIQKTCCITNNNKTQCDKNTTKLNCVLSLLSYLLKSPVVPKNTPIINALNSQRECIVNFLRACVALPPLNHLLLEYKTSPCNHQ